MIEFSIEETESKEKEKQREKKKNSPVKSSMPIGLLEAFLNYEFNFHNSHGVIQIIYSNLGELW